MKINIIVWLYLAQFFLDWETFQKNIVEKIQKHFILSNFFSKIVPFMRYLKKCTRKEGPHDNMAHSHSTLGT